jgi:hypothetical protein
MTTLQVGGTIAWPKDLPPSTRDWHRTSIVVDDAGAFALVRYLDVQRDLCAGLLWDLSKRGFVLGEHIDLHASGTLAVRRTATGLEIVDLTSGRVAASIDSRLDMALSPDAAFVVQRPRRDVDRKTVRETTRVHPLHGGKPLELPTRSVLEAFVGDGRLITVAERGAITLWDLASAKEVGKLPAFAKPASIRVAPSGTRVALSAFDGQYAVYDLDSPSPVAKGKSKIIFNDDVAFDGTRFRGTNILFDVETGRAKSHENGWLKGPRSGGRGQTVGIDHSNVGVVTKRDVVGNPVVEVWDVDAEKKLAAVEIQPRADSIAFAAGKLAVAHLPAGDKDWPALTLLGVSLAPQRKGAKPAADKAPPPTKTGAKKVTTRKTTKTKTR